MDDRRFVFLRVSDERKDDYDYFKQLYKAMNDPVQLGAFVDLLAATDITDFNIRAKPNTGELLEQKLLSIRGFARYWYEVLDTGYVDVTSFNGALDQWEDSRFISTINLSENYKQHLSKSKQYQAAQSKEIKKG